MHGNHIGQGSAPIFPLAARATQLASLTQQANEVPAQFALRQDINRLIDCLV